MTTKKQRQLDEDVKHATGYHGMGGHGHGFANRYDATNKAHDMQLRNAEGRPGISHSFGTRTCAKCSLKKPVKGGRKFGAKFVCGACAATI
jgi:hypothetical protein